jgi:hypothetical protein
MASLQDGHAILLFCAVAPVLAGAGRHLQTTDSGFAYCHGAE